MSSTKQKSKAKKLKAAKLVSPKAKHEVHVLGIIKPVTALEPPIPAAPEESPVDFPAPGAQLGQINLPEELLNPEEEHVVVAIPKAAVPKSIWQKIKDLVNGVPILGDE
jgi:hypothetical protein